MSDLTEQVILVDSCDNPIGVEGKLTAHQQGLKHRAFSVFLFNEQGEVLIQKRADGKYHSGGLWANSCCGHPRPGEDLLDAATRRMNEELGMDCEARRFLASSYMRKVSNTMIENEYVHILVGLTSQLPVPNPEEVSDTRWVSWRDLKRTYQERPFELTAWLRYYIEKFDAQLFEAASLAGPTLAQISAR